MIANQILSPSFENDLSSLFLQIVQKFSSHKSIRRCRISVELGCSEFSTEQNKTNKICNDF